MPEKIKTFRAQRENLGRMTVGHSLNVSQYEEVNMKPDIEKLRTVICRKQYVDGLQEYFKMSYLAIMLLIEQREQNMPPPDTSPNLLYEKCVAEDVPFEKWHRWIKHQLGVD